MLAGGVFCAEHVTVSVKRLAYGVVGGRVPRVCWVGLRYCGGPHPQAATEAYLTSLGVDFEFAAAAFDYAEWKEATEYASWLADVKEFLE